MYMYVRRSECHVTNVEMALFRGVDDLCLFIVYSRIPNITVGWCFVNTNNLKVRVSERFIFLSASGDNYNFPKVCFLVTGPATDSFPV